MSDREKLIAVWPPQAPLARWIERVWFAPLERWDVAYYLKIATVGYQSSDGTAQFHPLYPALASSLVRLGEDPLVALTLLSFFSAILLIVAFYNLARLKLGPSDAQFAALSFVLSPFAFALMIPYPEALFLLCAVMCFYWAKTDRWWLAGVAGALATLTRQQGLFLLFPLGWMIWERIRSLSPQQTLGSRQRCGFQVAWLAVLSMPLAYGGWLLYRAAALGDLQVSATSLHDLIYTLFISPSASQVVPVQTFLWPWDALARIGAKLSIAPDLDIITNLMGGIWFLVLLVLAWRHLNQAIVSTCWRSPSSVSATIQDPFIPIWGWYATCFWDFRYS